MRRDVFIWFAIAIWLASSAVGFGIWQEYEATPGAAASAIASLISERAQVTVYLHPRCPCSRATLDELALVLEQHPGEAEVEIVFVRPPGVEEGWERGALWERASALPGVRLRVDVGGREAEAAGAATSGTVVYSNDAGRVLFQGGITRGRGARGANAGRTSLEARLCGRETGSGRAPIFGCPLATPQQCEPSER